MEHSSCFLQEGTTFPIPFPLFSDPSDVTDPSLSPKCVSGKSVSVCYSDRGGSVLWSAGSGFVVCCLELASPLFCVLFLTSTVAGTVPRPFSLWDGGLTWGFSRDSDAAGIVLGVFSWLGGDTSSFSSVWGNAGAVLGLFFQDVGVTGGFSMVWVSTGGLSRMDRALSRAAAGLKSWGDDASC